MRTTLLVALALIFLSAPVLSQETPALKTQKDKVSYGIGVDMGKSFKQQGIDVDVDVMVRGMKDAFAGGKLQMTDQELFATMSAYQTELKQKHAAANKIAMEENKKVGDAFLAANRTKEGVMTLPSGLQYKVIKEGQGKKPTDADTVECHYRGTLVNGTEFDSSYRRGEPIAFKVSSVIAGWKEALKLMPVGSKWQLFVPPHLAYGVRGAGMTIGPNATLIFEVELLAVKPL